MKVTFMELDSLNDLVIYTNYFLESFESNHILVKNYITVNAIKDIENLYKETIPELKTLIELLDKEKDYTYKSIEQNHRITQEINDTYINNTTPLLKRFTEIVELFKQFVIKYKLSKDFYCFLENYEIEMNKLCNFNDYISFQEEYRSKDDVNYYMKKKKELDELISNFKFSSNLTLEEQEDELIKLTQILEQYAEQFWEFRRILCEMCDFKNTFTLNFWNKFNHINKTVFSIDGMFEGKPSGYIVNKIITKVESGKRDTIIGASYKFCFENNNSKYKEIDKKLSKGSKQSFCKIEELESGCFKCQCQKLEDGSNE